MLLPPEIEKIRPEMERRIGELGAELIELDYRRAGGRAVLSFVVDNEPGVTLDECVRINQALGEYLDELGSEAVSGSYFLEVNSPGLDRPLKTDRDFKKAVGEHLRVTYQDEQGKSMMYMAQLTAYEDKTLKLVTEPKGIALSVPASRVLKAVRDIRIK